MSGHKLQNKPRGIVSGMVKLKYGISLAIKWLYVSLKVSVMIHAMYCLM